MKNASRYLKATLAALGMLVLILDTKTALQGAAEGLELCIRTVIPSLLPFFVLSGLMTGTLFGAPLPFLRPLGKLCGIPDGAESLLVVGFLGGYPVGAQCVTQAYRSGCLDMSSAKRLLGFCSNAGPAFLFGMSAFLFSDSRYPWLLFLIQILSVLTVGSLLPGKEIRNICSISTESPSISQTMKHSLQGMTGVCGWIILFRVLLNICDRWFLWLLPTHWKAVFIAICELSNGMLAFGQISSQGLRFVLCSTMLSFGGLCVTMQTISATEGLGLGAYLPGKLMQSCFSALLSWITVIILGECETKLFWPLCILFSIIAVFLIFRTKSEKNSSISQAISV